MHTDVSADAFVPGREPSMLRRAHDHFRSGDLEKAREVLEKSLRVAPNDYGSLHLLGLVHARMGSVKRGAQYIAKATQVDARNIRAYGDLAELLSRLGDHPAAIQVLRHAIAIDPADHDLQLRHVKLLQRASRLSEALAAVTKFLGIKPDCAEGLVEKAALLRKQKKVDEALDACERADELAPGLPAVLNEKANILRETGRLEEAVVLHQRALEIDPNFVPAHCDLGATQREAGRVHESLEAIERAVRLDPENPELYVIRGMFLKSFDRPRDAVLDYDTALRLYPRQKFALFNKANVLAETGRLNDALACYRKAIDIDGQFHAAVWNMACVMLLKEDFAEGFEKYEFRSSRLAEVKKRNYTRPQLSASDPLAGKKLLIWKELYLGDTIQFCRYAKIAEEMGASVTIEVSDNMRELVQTMSPTIKVTSKVIWDGGFDYQLPILSAPGVFGIEKGWRAGSAPYLRADPARLEKWRSLIGDKGYKVGICWQGSSLSTTDGRSFPLEHFAGIASIPGVRLISLQKGDGVEQLQSAPYTMNVEDLGDDFDSSSQAFLDSAAVIRHLDLVITCDTAIAHLAGAIGAKTWVVLKKIPDWRWMLNRGDSPWYPSMRLFRQDQPKNWGGVFEEVEVALKEISQQYQRRANRSF